MSVSKLSSGLVYEPGIARFIRNFASEAADLARGWLHEPRRDWTSVSGRSEQEKGTGALGGSECELGRGQSNLNPCPPSLPGVNPP